MSRSIVLRVAVLCVLSVLLAAPWSAAAPKQAAPKPAASAPLLSQLWSRLVVLWSDIGCIIDPNGACRPATPQGDIGCGLDPNGACHP